MRGSAVFVAGVLVGLALQLVTAQGRDVAGLNHVLVRVADMEQATTFYTRNFGFTEAFAFKNPDGSAALTYLQISRDTFLELQPATAANPPGLGHIGLHVDDLKGTVGRLRARGLTVRDPAPSQRTGALLSSVEATPGVTFELLEFPPESLQRKAMTAWK